MIVVALDTGTITAAYSISFPNLNGLDTFPLRDNIHAEGAWFIASNSPAHIVFYRDNIGISGDTINRTFLAIHRNDYINSEFVRIYNELVDYRDAPPQDEPQEFD